MGRSIYHHKRLTCPLLLFLLFVSPSVGASESINTKDASFFAGYITAILERDLEWERDSYRLDIQGGVAFIILLKGGEERQAEAYDRLKGIEGLQGINILVKASEEEIAEQISPLRRRFYERMSISPQGVFISTGDVFQPFIADPKQPDSLPASHPHPG